MKTVAIGGEHAKPSPPTAVGGEGWVRGQRLRTDQRIRSATSLPLTPNLSPKHSLGERESTALEAA